MTAGTDYLSVPLGKFIDAVAAAEPAPGGGAVCAVTVALAAALTAMAAGFARGQFDGAEAAGQQAEELRSRAGPLARADAAAYGNVLTTFALPPNAPGRADSVRRALSRAADVPLEVAEIGAVVVEVADRLAAQGNPNLRGDAMTARLLAAAAVRAACGLVEINLSDSTDPRLARARQLAGRAG